MDQPNTSNAPSAHPAEELRKQRANANVVRTHLYNQGLLQSGVTIAFVAVQWATRDPALAWEAARRHELQMLGDAIDVVPTGRDARSDRSGMTSLALVQRRAARQDEINRVRGLTNPFAPQQLLAVGEDILIGNADLERAA